MRQCLITDQSLRRELKIRPAAEYFWEYKYSLVSEPCYTNKLKKRAEM